MRRVALVALCAAVVLAGCFGGGDDDEKDSASLPLPPTPPVAVGPATGPDLEAKALFAASDELEEQTGSLDTAQVERRSGAFIIGDTTVGYSVDNISAYDLRTGDELWTAPLDLGGGTVCFVSEPDRDVKHFTVAYGESGYCPSLATIRVTDGKVVNTTERLSEGSTFEGESVGGSVEDLITVEGKDYVLDSDGVVWQMAKGEPEPMARLEASAYFNLHTTADGSQLIGSRLSDEECRVDAYELPSFEHSWTTPGTEALPGEEDRCIVQLAPGDPTWLLRETAEEFQIAQLDKKTGQPIGRTTGTRVPDPEAGPVPEGTFDLTSAALHFDRTLGMPDGSMVFAQPRGISRYSVEDDELLWELDLSQFEMESPENYPELTVLPQGLTDDGYLVATISNNIAVEVVAVDVEKGTLVGRWPVPEEFRNGFQVQPGAALYDGGLVLTRNFEAWEYVFADHQEVKPPEGDRFDIGVYTFPPPGEEVEPAARPVPTAGPVELDATPLAAVESEDPNADISAGAVYAGDAIVTYSGSRLAGFDKAGKELWTGELPGGGEAQVCSVSEPDRRTKAIVMAYRQGSEGEDHRCVGLTRVGAVGGTVEEVPLSKQQKSVVRVITHAGQDYVITEDDAISTIEDAALQEIANLGRDHYHWASTPEDPSLLVASAPSGKGNDWVVEGFRVPSFEKVWSRPAGKVFGAKLLKDNFATPWAGNGLWVSAVFGDYADENTDMRDGLVKLDPASGKVVAKTGVKKVDYLADDLEKFSVTAASTAGPDTVGFDDGSVVLPQRNGIMRYSLTDDTILWATDISSIRDSMERARRTTQTHETYDLTDGGKSILVTLSNDISTEVMTLDPDSGEITGRWKIPVDRRNGLQTAPDVTPWAGGVALSRFRYSWLQAYGPDGQADPPDGPIFDVGLFALAKQSADEE